MEGRSYRPDYSTVGGESPASERKQSRQIFNCSVRIAMPGRGIIGRFFQRIDREVRQERKGKAMALGFAAFETLRSRIRKLRFSKDRATETPRI
jgi:hypothetical protein